MKMLVDISRTKFLILKNFLVTCWNSDSKHCRSPQNQLWTWVLSSDHNSAGHRAYSCPSVPRRRNCPDCYRMTGSVTSESPDFHVLGLCWPACDIDEKWRRWRTGTSSPFILSTQSPVSIVIYNAKQEKATYLIWSKSKQTETWFSLSRLC